MQNGRLLRMSLELLIGCAVCLAAALLIPLTLWQAIGEAGSALLILAVATALTGALFWRQARAATRMRDLVPASSMQSIG